MAQYTVCSLYGTPKQQEKRETGQRKKVKAEKLLAPKFLDNFLLCLVLFEEKLSVPDNF